MDSLQVLQPLSGHRVSRDGPRREASATLSSPIDDGARISRQVSESSEGLCVREDASRRISPDGTGGHRWAASDDRWPQPVMLPIRLGGGSLGGLGLEPDGATPTL